MSRLVVVSNRVPVSHDEPGAGGLAVALASALGETGGLWFGWNGEIADDPAPPQVDADGPFTLATVPLSAEEFAGYYERFANRTLWPLFHGRLDLSSFEHDAHAVWRAVNRRFAEALAPLLRPDDTIWVHDYHLIPLGRELRRLGVRAPIGLFLHIPFPPRQIAEALPWCAELVEALLSYDLVGLQAERDVRNLRDAVETMPGGRAAGDGRLALGSASTRAGAFPIGIDAGAFADLAGSPDVERRTGWLRRRNAGRAIVIGVDRLDYAKGLRERFEAFAKMLDDHPSLRGGVALMQVAAPSREGIAEYQAMRGELEALVGRINGRYGTFDWMPLRYINRGFGHRQIAALFRFARVGLATPLCDGMNLVAKEFVAAQDPRDPGVLVLSRFTGAAERMPEALLVNPFDRDGTAAAIHRALSMPLEERVERWEPLMAELRRHDVHAWRRGFLAALAETREADGASGPRAA